MAVHAKILPIMPALCSMLFTTHYDQNYASIIGASIIGASIIGASLLSKDFPVRVFKFSGHPYYESL